MYVEGSIRLLPHVRSPLAGCSHVTIKCDILYIKISDIDDCLDGSDHEGFLNLTANHPPGREARGFRMWIVSPLSSDRQHLSYEVRLEVRGDIIRTVVCCIVY